MSAQPWMKFYPQDWRADEQLRICSLAARGLWIEMLAIMHRSERYGHLLIGGRPPTDAQLAIQAGAPPEEISALTAELESAGVFSRGAKGVIYSRRMTRDHRRALNARKNGKKGGNPTLRKQKEKPGWDNQQDKGEDKPRSQKPDNVPYGTGDPPNLAAVIFGDCLAYLTSSGMPERNARKQLGKWRARLGDPSVIAAIARCQAGGISDPNAYMEGIVKQHTAPADERKEWLRRNYPQAVGAGQ